jgi:glyoxylase-like metal-dependent hydrolase (beta-lactamase superfamily II)
VNVHCLPAGPLPTNAYLLAEPSLGLAVLIDAPLGIWDRVEPVLGKEGCRLGALWLTHGHWDHTQGAAEVVRRSGVPVSGHRDDQVLYETPEVMRPLTPEEIVMEPVTVDRWLADGELLEALGERVEVRHVPGHCPGSLLFYFPGRGVAFGGDALFRESVGRTDLPGGDHEALMRSIRTRIYTLADETTVFPGHGGPTSVGHEKENNPYVRA